jgi:la-related protein 1
MPKMPSAYTYKSPLLSNNKNYTEESRPKIKMDGMTRERIQTLKNELIETPNSKHKYKQVIREMKDLEKQGFSAVVKCAFAKIMQIPKKIHWRVILDLADFAKRESRFREAKLLFKLVSYLQPYAYQGWLEYAKMEEECGNQLKS